MLFLKDMNVLTNLSKVSKADKPAAYLFSCRSKVWLLQTLK